MIKLVIEYEKWDNTTLSAKHSYSLLFVAEKYSVRHLLSRSILKDDLDWCDILISVRPATPVSVSIANCIHRANKPYVVMFDDDLLNLSALAMWRRKCIKKCISKASLVISPNPLIADEYSAIATSRKGVVVNTPVVISGRVPTRKNAAGSIRIVYAASMDHASFFESMLGPILNKYALKQKENGIDVEMTFVGVKPDVSPSFLERAKVVYQPMMPYDEYLQFMECGMFDIGLAPIPNNPFANRKYFNKYIEYAKFGIVGIYSECMPYTLAVKNRENGLLARNSPSDWLNALCFASAHSSLRMDCASRAWLDLRRNYSVEAIEASLTNELMRLIEHSSKSLPLIYRPPSAFKTGAFGCVDLFAKTKMALSSMGFGGFIDIAMNRARRR